MTSKSIPTAEAARFLSPIDLITAAYCLWIVGYLAVGAALGRAIDAHVHLPAYLSVLTLVFLLAWAQRQLAKGRRPRLAAALSFIRGIYPVLFFAYFFTSGYAVNRIVFADWLDPWFMRLDHKLFGYLPSMVWGVRWGGRFWQELFHFAYFCYYPMIAGLPVYLYFKNRKGFEELIFALTFVFYSCYFIYSLLPVIGGRYLPEAMRLASAYREGPFTRLMALIYNTSGHLGGAFPSSHIAISLVLTVAALRHVRPLGYLFCVISLFLSIATVHCHYHWFVDAVAGVFTGILGYHLAQRLRKKLSGGNA